MEATIQVFTYREGLLGKLGHDLRLTLHKFEVTARGSEILGTFQPSSLAVDGAMIQGRLDVNALSASDRQKIQDSMAESVLRTREHSQASLVARITSKVPPYRLSGQLTLCGVTRPIAVVLEERGERLVGALEITPSQFGIKPYRALGGALKVQDRIVVAVDASADWLRAGGELNPNVELSWAPQQRSSVYPKASVPRSALAR